MKTSVADIRPTRFLISYTKMAPNHLDWGRTQQALRVPQTRDHADPQLLAWHQPASKRQCAGDVPWIPVSPAPSRASSEVPDLPRPCCHTMADSATATLKAALPPLLWSAPSSCTTAPQTVGVDGGRKSGRAHHSPNMQHEPWFEDTSSPVSGGSDTCKDSLWDFSRPESSQFSRSTSLSSRWSSVLSGVSKDEQQGKVTLCQHHSSLFSTPGYLGLTHSEIPEKSPLTLKSGLCGDGSLSTSWHKPELSMDGAASLTPGHMHAFSTSKGATLSSGKVWHESVSPRWPVLPPISPVRDGRGTEASHSSRFSPILLHAFDELDAHPSHTGSVLSQELSGDNDPDHSSPDTVLSMLAASLALDCTTDDSASLSHVRLMLLDYHPPVGCPSPPPPDWGSQSNDGRGLEMADVAKRGLGFPADTGSLTSSASTSSHTTAVGHGTSRQVRGRNLTVEETWSLSSALSLSAPSGHQGSASRDTGSTLDHWPHHGTGDLGEGMAPCALGRGSERRRHSVDEERSTRVKNIFCRLQEGGITQAQPRHCQDHPKFEDFEFLAKYCIFSQEKLATYKRAFEAGDSDGDGYLSCVQVLLALKEVIPPEVLSEDDEIYVYRILELVDFRVADGLTDFKLFAVIASLAQKVAALDDFMRSLIGELDFRSLEVKLSKAKQLFLFLVEAQAGCINVEQFLVELKAGGIRQDHEEAVRSELRHIGSFDLLDFLAHLPLFVLIHNSVISNPLDESRNL